MIRQPGPFRVGHPVCLMDASPRVPAQAFDNGQARLVETVMALASLAADHAATHRREFLTMAGVSIEWAGMPRPCRFDVLRQKAWTGPPTALKFSTLESLFVASCLALKFLQRTAPMGNASQPFRFQAVWPLLKPAGLPAVRLNRAWLLQRRGHC